MYHMKVSVISRMLLKAWRKYKDTGLHGDWLIYQEERNKATKEIRDSRRSYEKKLADNIKKNPKAFYKYARQGMKSKDKVGPLVD